MGNYVTASEVQTFRVDGDIVDLSDYSKAAIDEEITLVEEFVEDLCNDIFYEKTATYKFDGSGTHKLFFHPKIPYRLISVTSCKDYDTDGSTLLDTYVEGIDFVKYDYYLETVRAFPGDSPRRRFDTGGVWPLGQQNIWIEGVWGRSSTPAAIKRVVKLLTIERLKPGESGLTVHGVQSATWPDFTIVYSAGGKNTEQLTGYIETDNLLIPHVNFVPMFQVVPNQKESYD